MSKTLYVIDGHSQTYMAYHAMGNLTAPDGRPTGAVYGFVNMLRKLLKEHTPDHLVIAFDHRGKTFRHEMYSEYKAHRPPMPDDLRPQLSEIKKILAAWPITVLERQGFEADDLLATLCRKCEFEDLRIVLVTMDKDARQLLLQDKVEIFDYRRNSFLTADKMVHKDGIRPDQMVDFLAMVGDASDNIPGIKLIGKKTATKLLKQYDSLDRILDTAEQIKGKVGENIRLARDQVLLSRELVKLDDRMPIELRLEDTRLQPPDPGTLIPLYRELGFTRLVEDLLDQSPQGAPIATDYRIADTDELASWVLAQLTKQPEIGIHVAQDGMGVSWQQGVGWHLPWSPELRKLLEAPRPRKVGHDLKQSLLHLARRGIQLNGISFDTMLAAYLLNPTLEQFSLPQLSLTHLGLKPDQIVSDEPLPLLAEEQTADRTAQWADLSLRLAQTLRPILARNDLTDLLEQLEVPLLRVLADMETVGICVDRQALANLALELSAQISSHRDEIHALAGETFNIDSPKQLADILFEKLELPRRRKTRTGWSTDAQVLEELSEQHPLPAEVLRYRQLVKLKSTYVDALPRLADPATGRIHTQFNQATAATGRLSSSHPNLQNIPIRTELGRSIRAAFIPGDEQVGEDGGLFDGLDEALVLVSADYSQVELRILAHVSGDPALRDAFLQGADIHRTVAARIAGISQAEVTDAQRRGAKTVNFGIIYGQTPFGLSQELGISQDEARLFIERYFEGFPQVRQFIDETIAKARKTGHVRTLMGRIRYLPDINAKHYARRAFAERTAVNTVIQGTAADLIKIAMIRTQARIEREQLPATLLLSIHDELLFECRPDKKSTVCQVVCEEMTEAMSLDVPLVVDVGTGRNWLVAGSRQELVAG